MTLFREIIEAAASSDTSVADLLRRCKSLSVRPHYVELPQWVDRELNGYTACDQLPSYRILHNVASRCDVYGPSGTVRRNMFIPLGTPSIAPKDVSLRRELAFYEDLLRRSSKRTIRIDWPFSFAGSGDGNVRAAWHEVPRGSIACMMNAVRNETLEFVIDIEKAIPDAGEAAVDSIPIPAGGVSNIFHNHFHGSVGSVAAGSQDFEQNATVNHNWDDAAKSLDPAALAGELSELRHFMLQEAQDATRDEAINAVGSAELEATRKNVPKALAWLSKAGAWAAEIAVKKGLDVAADALTKRALGMI